MRDLSDSDLPKNLFFGLADQHFEQRDVLSYSQINSFSEFDQIKKTEEWRNFWNNPRYNKNEEALFEAEYLIKSERNAEALAILNSSDFGSREYIKNTLLAEIAFNEGAISTATNYLNKVLSSNPKYVQGIELSYRIYLEQKQYSLNVQKTAQNAARQSTQSAKPTEYF